MNKRRVGILTTATVFTVGLLVSPVVFADRYQEQIDRLNNESAAKQAGVNQLGAEAANLQEAIAKLAAEISSLQTQINANQQKRDQTVADIAKAEADLAQQRKYLSDSVKASYVDGDVSSLEMLASSQNINDFVDQQQYQNSVQGQLQRTLDTIKQLEAKLSAEKAALEQMIANLGAMQARVASQQAEQARLLALNQQQQAELDGQIKANASRVSELRRQQAAENSALTSKRGGAPRGVPGGGGYPWGYAAYPSSSPDPWGMYLRECVSYTAWKVDSSGRTMPYWGGRGNANQWDDNARAAGIPVDRNPRAGDVAVSNSGTYGHVMYVEAVAGDGSIQVSDYNQQLDGNYRIYWIDAGTVRDKALVFIHF